MGGERLLEKSYGVRSRRRKMKVAIGDREELDEGIGWRKLLARAVNGSLSRRIERDAAMGLISLDLAGEGS